MQHESRASVRGGHYGADATQREADQDPGERIEVTVVVRPRTPIPSSVVPFRALTREEFVARHGASPEDLAAVVAFASSHGLEVTGTSAARRSVFLSGACADFARAFGVAMGRYPHTGGTHRGFAGRASAPGAVADRIELVVGLHDHPLTARAAAAPVPEAAASEPVPKPPDPERLDLGSAAELAKFYGFPDLDGEGQCIGVVEMGGGYRQQDLDQFRQPAGSIDCTDVCVDGGANRPGTERFLKAFADWTHGKGPNKYAAKPTVEVTMDVSLLGALVPKAKLLVYFGDDTERSLIHVLQTALFDSEPQPSVISISWGFQEREIQASGGRYVDLARYLDELFLCAAHMGITICAASGDYGASDEKEDGLRTGGVPDVEFPASSPHVLACGGTTILRDGEEVVWNADFPPPTPTTPRGWTKHGASGGGFSRIFERPEWQENLPSKNRGVPDVAVVADPRCGARFVLAGEWIPSGGTSAAAPIWAALVARINQALGRRVGLLNPILYKLAATEPDLLKDVTRGDNRYQPGDTAGWDATPGWDPCTGWGTPRGESLLAALRAELAGGSSAPNPQPDTLRAD